MREGEWSEREQQGCVFAGCVGPAVGGTNGEDDLLGAVIALAAKPCCEGFGVHLPSAAIEQD